MLTLSALGSSQVLNFDGSNDYVSIPRSIQDSFTIGFWFKPEANGSGTATNQWYGSTGLVDGEVGGVTNDFGISWSAGTVHFGVGNPDVTIHSSSLALNQWYYVAATRDKATGVISLYVDGALQATATGGTQSLTSPSVLNIGRLQTAVNGYFKGSIDDLQIWSKALTASEVNSYRYAAPSMTATGLEGYYTFEGGSSTLTNSAGATPSSRNGTLYGFALTGTSSNYVSDGTRNNTKTIPANPGSSSNVTWDFLTGPTSGGGDQAFEFLAAGESLELTYTVKAKIVLGPQAARPHPTPQRSL
jgi:Concanavalin A-like lectin/glucanases superfamily